jgi:hypothetical protein
MEVVGVDDFRHGASNVPFLGDARVLNGALTNITFLRGVFAKFKFDAVYLLPDPPGVFVANRRSSAIYATDLVGFYVVQTRDLDLVGFFQLITP